MSYLLYCLVAHGSSFLYQLQVYSIICIRELQKEDESGISTISSVTRKQNTQSKMGN